MMITKVLIGVDDSKYAEHAARYGFDIARKFNAEVGLVNIVEPIALPEVPSGMDPIMNMSAQPVGVNDLELMEIQKHQSENIVDRTIKNLAEDLTVSHFTEYGSTAEGIINCSKEFGADLIVIGTHSRSGLDRLLMGSVAEHVVRHSEIPVLVVPLS